MSVEIKASLGHAALLETVLLSKVELTSAAFPWRCLLVQGYLQC